MDEPSEGGVDRVSEKSEDWEDEFRLSWERRDELGLFRAAYRMASDVVDCGEEFLVRLAWKGRVGDALLFLWLGLLCCVGVWAIVPVGFGAASGGGTFITVVVTVGALGLGVPVSGIGGAVFLTGSIHAIAWLLGAREGNFEATFRVVCYLLGGCVFWLAVLPIACMVFALPPAVFVGALKMVATVGNAGKVSDMELWGTWAVIVIAMSVPVAVLACTAVISVFVGGCAKALQSTQSVEGGRAKWIVALACGATACPVVFVVSRFGVGWLAY